MNFGFPDTPSFAQSNFYEKIHKKNSQSPPNEALPWPGQDNRFFKTCILDFRISMVTINYLSGHGPTSLSFSVSACYDVKHIYDKK